MNGNDSGHNTKEENKSLKATAEKEKQEEYSGGKKQDLLGAGLKADRELEEIFLRSLGGNRGKNTSKESGWQAKHGKTAVDRTEKSASAGNRPVQLQTPKKHYLLVDGYNIIHAWEELRELAALNLDAARAALQDILANYQGFRGMTLILVFDAYKVRGGKGSVEKYHNIYVVYTMEAQTADAYIFLHPARERRNRLHVHKKRNLRAIRYPALPDNPFFPGPPGHCGRVDNLPGAP